MYPFHASPSLPGPHSRWTRLEKSHWAWSPHDSLLSLSLSVLSPSSLFPRQPAALWLQPEQSNSTGHFTAWSHDRRVQALGVTAWLEVQWQPGVIWVELIVLFLLLFNNTTPPTPPLQPSPKLPSPPLSHASGSSEEDQSACPSINTDSSWQNTQTLTNWST